MADNKGWGLGQYDEGPPAFNFGNYKSLAELIAYTGGLLDDIARDRPWYQFEDAVVKAMDRLDQVNKDFAAKISDVDKQMKGASADAFNSWANDLLAKSRALHDRVSAESFHKSIGNIGHTIRWFYDHWWDTVAQAEKDFKLAQGKIRNAAYQAAEMATSGAELNAIVEQTKKAISDLKDGQEAQLIERLKNSFINVGEQYRICGRNLSTLEPAGGYDYDPVAPDTGGSGNSKSGGSGSGGGSGKSGSGSGGSYTGSGSGNSGTGTGGGSGYDDTGSGAGTGTGGAGDRGLADQRAAEQRAAGQRAAEEAKKAGQDAIAGLGGGSGYPGTGGGSGTGAGGAGDQGLAEQAKKTGQDAISGLGGGSGYPSTDTGTTGTGGGSGAGAGGAGDQGLSEQAKKAGQDAISGLGGGVGGNTGKGDVPTVGGPGSTGNNKALEDAKNAAKDAIEGVKGKYKDDPGIQDALDKAETGVGKAIGDLDPKHAKEFGDAKDKALKAMDDVRDRQQDPAVKDALDKAQKAVGDAINDVKPGEEGLKHAREAADKAFDDAMKDADPKTKAALEEAKKAVDKSYDDAQAKHDGPFGDLKHKSLDAIDKIEDQNKDKPAVHDALEKAKEAIAKAVDPGNGTGLSTDGQPAADKALDELIKNTADPDAKHALEEAKKAIDDIRPDATQLPGSHDKDLLDSSKSAANKAFDDVLKDADPATRKALEEARDAVGKSIDDLSAPGTSNLADDSHLKSYLSGDGASGGAAGGGGGGSHGIAAAGTPLPTSSEGPGGGGQRAQFDTDVAGQRGYIAPGQSQGAGRVPTNTAIAPGSGVPAQSFNAQQGTPMSGMPMSGMGGMGGGQQNSQREPQIWLQADRNAWTDSPDDEDETVLGRKK